jgi:hypothetical protein
MRLRRPSETCGPFKVGRRRVTDYSQRSTKLTLFAIVAAVLFVSAVAERAADPKMRQWLRQMNQSDGGQEQAVDSRIEPRLRTQHDDPGTIVAVMQPQPVSEPLLSEVQDDTVFRPAEREVWFSLLERVRDTEADELRQQSAGRVTYLQLFRQPIEYRGKVVTVSGTVKLAYRLQAPQNDLGIKDYFVYWIHPYGGPSSPIVVYALEAPAGFPPLKDKDVQGEMTPLHEEVEVTGAFFKRWAYAAKDGAYTAPLIVARSIQWQQRLAANGGETPMPMEPGKLAAAIVAALLFTVGLSAIVWRQSRRTRERAYATTIEVGSRY